MCDHDDLLSRILSGLRHHVGQNGAFREAPYAQDLFANQVNSSNLSSAICGILCDRMVNWDADESANEAVFSAICLGFFTSSSELMAAVWMPGPSP